MVNSNRDNTPKPRKRLWPFGKKRQEKKQSNAENVIVDNNIPPKNIVEKSDKNIPEISSSEKESISATKVQTEKISGSKAEQATEKSEIEILESKKQASTPALDQQERKKSFFARMRSGLSKTRNLLIGGVATLMAGKKKIDDDLLEELEMHLISADFGVEATRDIIEKLTEKIKRKELKDIDALVALLKKELLSIIEPCEQPLIINCNQKPYVILVVGVNGVGKTTTIGKMACQLKSQGHKVILAAGDTFRAAAVEQLQVWGSRNDVPVIAQGSGADSASVIYDAHEAAKARGYDVLIADTAGRLHNKEHLMKELKKIKRILTRLDETSPHEVMLVVDAGTGQNAINQASLFDEAVRLTGITLTKLDGTAKGGIIFALAKKMQKPVRFLGVGEKIEDLRPFSSQEFVEALFADTQIEEKEPREEIAKN